MAGVEHAAAHDERPSVTTCAALRALGALHTDAEALARAVSESLTPGEQSPLADALRAYLAKYPWSDL